jgi:hypothetical protein
MNRWIVASVLLVVLGAFSAAANAAEVVTVGNATVVVRTVTGTLDAEDRKLALADDVYHNELIKTDVDSATEIIFLDQTKLSLGPESSLTLDSVVYDPDPTKSSFVATASKGVFRFVTGNLPKKSYTIHTPSATIGIRGTIFQLSILPTFLDDGSSATVVEFTLEEGAADIVGCGGEQISLEQGGKQLTLTKSDTGVCTQRVSEF